MAVINIDRTLRLADGRTLGFAEFGVPDGKPVFYFHGWPSSRIEPLSYHGDEIAARLNVRLIAVDRPGIGLSDFKPGRRFVDWPDDVCELADRLGVQRFSVMSYSAGSPYAAACAWKLADRLTSAAIVSGLGQPLSAPGAADQLVTRTMWTMARIHPRVLWLMLKAMKPMLASAPKDKLPANAKQAMMAEADFAYIQAHPAVNGANLAGGLEGMRRGEYGPAYEASLYWKPWGFRLEDIRIPVDLWHGEADINAPFAAHGQYLARAIPHNRAKVYPGEGHISLIHKYFEDILVSLAR